VQVRVVVCMGAGGEEKRREEERARPLLPSD
jgi:hypothetical protein